MKLNIKSYNLSALLVFMISVCISCSKVNNLTSPDGTIKVVCKIDAANEIVYNISKNGENVILPSKLGIVMKDSDFSKNMKIESVSNIRSVSDNYQLLYGKQKDCSYKGNEQTFTFKNAEGKVMNVVFRVSNDGVAFRYQFPDKNDELKYITEETTSFAFSSEARAWMQPMAIAKTGWCRTNPSYEEHYLQDIPAGTESPMGKGWIFPALLKSGNNWILLTETDLDGSYCGSRLNVTGDATYRIGFPEEVENYTEKNTYPQSVLPWETPWRVIVIGDLKTITESTLETDLAAPSVNGDFSWVKPGKSSWSWILLKDDSTVYDVQKKYIDYAADMNWEYCLVDADWDKKIGYEKIAELSVYAQSKNIGLLLWYNSSGEWNDTQYSPKSMLLTHEQRSNEFSKLKQMGIKGVKVDFFGGDGQSMIQYYVDLMKDAADNNLMINFHGCTYPRSWHRTFPNLVSMESIMGMEFVTFDQRNADKQPNHGAMLNYTRNVFSPMDFTPMCLVTIPNIERKTTNAYELATAILFQSGVQHYAERPEGMAIIPSEVKELIKEIPALWDESVFIDGYPGKLTVIARRSGNTWYIAGINGEDSNKNLSLDISFLNIEKGIIYNEGNDPVSFNISEIAKDSSGKINLQIKANGGFVCKFE